MKPKKKTNVAETSIEAYIAIKTEGQILREQDLALEVMERYGNPLTSRLLSKLTGKERTNITRVLYNLERMGRIVISHTGKCPITNKRVSWYKLTELIQKAV